MTANPAMSAIADTKTAYHELNADADAGVMLATEGFRLLGRALSVIRRDELYRVAGFPSFRAYLNHKTGEWKTAHGKSPSYKHVLNIVAATNWLDTVAAVGLTLEAGSEYEVRQARKLVKAIGLVDNVEALATMVHEYSDGMNTLQVKTFTSLLHEMAVTGAIPGFSGETIPLVKHALDSEAFESSKRALEHARSNSIREADIVEQLDLFFDFEYRVCRYHNARWYVLALRVPYDEDDRIFFAEQPTIYDALLSALATLYAECEGL